MVFPKAIGSKTLIAFVVLCFFTELGSPSNIRKVRSSIYVGREGLEKELTGHEPEGRSKFLSTTRTVKCNAHLLLYMFPVYISGLRYLKAC